MVNNCKFDIKLILNVSEIFFWVKDIIIKKKQFRTVCVQGVLPKSEVCTKIRFGKIIITVY